MVRTIQMPRRKAAPRRNKAPLPAPSTRVLRSQSRAATQAQQDIQAQQMPRRQQPARVTKSTPKRKRLDPWYPKRKVNKNAAPQPRAPPPTHFTCRICIEELPVDQFIPWVPPKRSRFNPRLEAPPGCIPHLARNPRRKNVDPVCKTCIGNSMAARLDTLGARSIENGCLEPGCEVHWTDDMIMRYMPAETLETYNLEMFNVWQQDVFPKPFKCLAPGCDAVGLPDLTAAGYPQVTCHTCSFRSCVNCNIPWHPKETCAEHAAKHVNETMTDPEKKILKLMQTKDGKRCPNCQLVIEKDGGCDSMWCPGCKKYFNWAAAASAVPGAKKAEPAPINGMYWQIPRDQVCEMDGIEAARNNTAAAGPAPVAAAA